jgi:hypothetical protein
MLLVDPDSRAVVANQPDAGGMLQRSGTVFIGVLPPSEPLADTPISWSGTRWTELLWPWPMREDPEMRHVTLAHELFHRIQENELHLVVSDGDNAHLRQCISVEWQPSGEIDGALIFLRLFSRSTVSFTFPGDSLG